VHKVSGNDGLSVTTSQLCQPATESGPWTPESVGILTAAVPEVAGL